MMDFADAIADCQLFDPGFDGPSFTWSRNGLWERLDRVLLGEHWTTVFAATRVTHLPRISSDHAPLLVRCQASLQVPRPSFRFQNMWTRHHTFKEEIARAWTADTGFLGMLNLQFKLSRIKSFLKRWNRDVFGNIFEKLREAEEAVTRAQAAYDGDPTATHRAELSRCTAEYVLRTRMEEDFWKQKAAIRWATEGERNSKFFHGWVRQKRVKSRIHVIQEGVQSLTSEEEIRQSAVGFFQQLLTSDTEQLEEPDLEILHRLPESVDRQGLCTVPESVEHCWDIVGADVVAAVEDFFRGWICSPKAMADPLPNENFNGEDTVEMENESGSEYSSVDSELEYRKEMKEQRNEDRKNGHFSGSEEEEDGSGDDIFETCRRDLEGVDPNLEYLMEIEDQRLMDEKNGHFVKEFGFDPYCYNTRRPVFPKSREGMAAAAKYFARVSDVMNLDGNEDGGKRENVAAVTHNANLNLDGNQGFKCSGLEVTGSGGSMAAQHGERGLTCLINNAPDTLAFGSCDKVGNNFNCRIYANLERPILEADSILKTPSHAHPDHFAEDSSPILDRKADQLVLGRGDNLEGNHDIKCATLEVSRFEGKLAVQCGEGGLTYSKNVAPDLVDLGSCNLLGKNQNHRISPNTQKHNVEAASFMIVGTHVSHQPLAEVNMRCMHEESVQLCLGSGDYGLLETDNSQKHLPANSTLSLGGYGADTSPKHAIDVAPVSAISAEVAAQLDLLEAQPIQQRHFQPASKVGPPSAAILIRLERNVQPDLPAQHLNKVIPSAFTPFKSISHIKQNKPKSILPPLSNTPRTNTRPIQTKPNLSSLPNTSRPNKKSNQLPHAHSQTLRQVSPKFKHAYHNPNTKTSPSISKEIEIAIFGNSMHDSHQPTPATSKVIENFHSVPLELSIFPPLKIPKDTAMAAREVEMLNCEEHHDNNVGQHGMKLGNKLPSKSWADMADCHVRQDDARGTHTTHANKANANGSVDSQPKIIFGRSMADVLKSGQPVDGPILLNHKRAEKCGEVRLVEGKPCLFFSADESSDLAGRLGPAIVGKFSHSIPTVPQIQKALGNLKLVGTMSWNFLNAKHVFIQLSEMCDYAKILNGPNNSPVWYIEHHPMRVFKWTPDFDPFFEIPIVALWCNILALPVHLFEESALIAVGNLLGHAVQVDRATISRSRVSFARICDEVDISQPIPEEISLDIAGKRVTLKVKWDKIPLFYGECRHVGHNAVNCYAFGRRPMPPKRDYSRGAPSKSGPSVTRHGDQPPPRQKRNDHSRESGPVRGQEGQPRGGHATGDHRTVYPQPQSPGGQPHGRQTLETQQRERHQVRGPAVCSLQKDSTLLEIALKAKGHLSDAGPSGTAIDETQKAEHDGFLVPKKKKKTRSAANRARKNARRRQRKEHNSTSAEVESEGGGDHRSAGHDSALESDRGDGSLSPSYRPQHVDGPLAMVAANNNMPPTRAPGFSSLRTMAQDTPPLPLRVD
ncbi:hypothetical protein AAHA92_19674 [Salvia divinorum]|uniref:DUF4283 domain-containing protein n=1 Tax=Salvia divinorum TaxID=28513 RepID=A0ABD1H639_SALDI